jgi:hypothetical protein
MDGSWMVRPMKAWLRRAGGRNPPAFQGLNEKARRLRQRVQASFRVGANRAVLPPGYTPSIVSGRRGVVVRWL